MGKVLAKTEELLLNKGEVIENSQNTVTNSKLASSSTIIHRKLSIGSGGVSTSNSQENRQSKLTTKIAKVPKQTITKSKDRQIQTKKDPDKAVRVLEEVGKNSEMNLKDLININNQRVIRRLRESEGLLWHYRLNHASLSQMRDMKQDMPELKDVVLHDDIKHCIHCRLAKAKKLPFTEERTRATRILEKVHSDTLGPITPCAFCTGHKYIMIFDEEKKGKWKILLTREK